MSTGWHRPEHWLDNKWQRPKQIAENAKWFLTSACAGSAIATGLMHGHILLTIFGFGAIASILAHLWLDYKWTMASIDQIYDELKKEQDE